MLTGESVFSGKCLQVSNLQHEVSQECVCVFHTELTNSQSTHHVDMCESVCLHQTRLLQGDR